jgi:hypothetical protein
MSAFRTDTASILKKSLRSIKVASEEDAKLAQKMGQPQPLVAVFPEFPTGMRGHTCTCWADRTPFSCAGVRQIEQAYL